MFFGAELLKYPRSGSPALRYFFLNDKLDRLQWKSKRRGREKEEAYGAFYVCMRLDLLEPIFQLRVRLGGERGKL